MQKDSQHIKQVLIVLTEKFIKIFGQFSISLSVQDKTEDPKRIFRDIEDLKYKLDIIDLY